MKKTKKQAFTLIELLVVIAIIGILATLAVVSLQSARAKARDAKRVSDVKQIQTALELYFNENNSYPVAATTALMSPMITNYMATFPTAPTPADNPINVTTCHNNTTPTNVYAYSGTATGYTLSFCLGGKTGELNPGVRTASQNGIQ